MMGLALFFPLFEYPNGEVVEAAGRCAAGMGTECYEAAGLLEKFHSALSVMELGEIQELYTSTFDMRPGLTTALGYHLFGDDVRRSVFMAKLKEKLELHGISAGVEMPDHLPLVLRLAVRENTDEERQAIIHEGLIPGISRMKQAFGEADDGNPYRHALDALLIYLRSVAHE